MAKSTTHSRSPLRRVRKSPSQAPRSERELSAQPRIAAEELGVISTPEETLSVYPEDLGSHFLSEAVEQGELHVREALDVERALLEAAELEESAVSDEEVALWTRILERMTDESRERGKTLG